MEVNRKTVALVLAVLAVAGCTLNKADPRRDNALTRIGDGQLIEPKRCALQVAYLTRPLRDPAVDVAIWNAADEQVLPSEVRHELEVNGLRLGLVSGSLPAEVESLLKAPASPKDAPSRVELEDGDNTDLTPSAPTPLASLLLCRENRAYGRDYHDAVGKFRVTVRQEGAAAVSLRFVPEIHHGPIQHAFSAVPTGGSLTPQQFMVRDGQEAESLRDLAATLILRPGQVAVLGCRPDREHSLGTFLFTQQEDNSDRLLQKVVLIWASRTSQNLPPLVPIEPLDSDMPRASRPKTESHATNKTANPQDDKVQPLPN